MKKILILTGLAILIMAFGLIGYAKTNVTEVND